MIAQSLCFKFQEFVEDTLKTFKMAASFDKPYGFSGSPRHTLFIILFVDELCAENKYYYYYYYHICFVPSFTIAERRALLSWHLHFVARYKLFVIIIIIYVIVYIIDCFVHAYEQCFYVLVVVAILHDYYLNDRLYYMIV